MSKIELQDVPLVMKRDHGSLRTLPPVENHSWWLKVDLAALGIHSSMPRIVCKFCIYSCLSGRSIRRIALGYTVYRSWLGVGTTFDIFISSRIFVEILYTAYMVG